MQIVVDAGKELRSGARRDSAQTPQEFDAKQDHGIDSTPSDLAREISRERLIG